MPNKRSGVHRDGTPFAAPNKPRWAKENRKTPENRIGKEVKVRLPEDVLDIVNEAAFVFGKGQRNSWLTRAALEAAKAQGFDVPFEVDQSVPRFDVSDERTVSADDFDPEFLRNQLG